MLDFHFSWVIPLLRGTFSRWRLHGNRVLETRFTFKKKTKKTTRQHQRVHQRRKKKKKKKKTRRQSRSDLGSPRPRSRRATHVAARDQVAPRPTTVSGLSFFSDEHLLWSPALLLLLLFLFFFFFLSAFSSAFGLHFGSWIFYFWVRNRVLETRFPCRRHLEKVPHRRGITHKNRALKARFRTLKSSL